MVNDFVSNKKTLYRNKPINGLIICKITLCHVSNSNDRTKIS